MFRDKTKEREEELLQIFCLYEENKAKSIIEAIHRYAKLLNIPNENLANKHLKTAYNRYVGN